MKLPIALSLIIFAAGLGFWLGKRQMSPPAPDQSPVSTQRLNCPTAAREDQIIKEAQEYYGKIFLLFLANIGIRLSEQQQNQFQQMISQNPKIGQTASPLTSSPVTTNIPTPADPSPTSNRPPMQDAPSPESADNPALGPMPVLKKPMSFYEETKLAGKGEKRALALNGTFAGKLILIGKHIKGDERVHEVELTIHMQFDEQQQPTGDFFLQLSNNKGPYSTSNGNGTNSDIRFHPERPNAVILNAGPGAFILFQDMSLSRGQYYDDGELVGAVELGKN